jgi:hypothetical protein
MIPVVRISAAVQAGIAVAVVTAAVVVALASGEADQGEHGQAEPEFPSPHASHPPRRSVLTK